MTRPAPLPTEVQHIRSQLAHQLQLLSRSEQHTRTALACWAQCLQVGVACTSGVYYMRTPHQCTPQIAGRSCSTPLEAAQHLHVAAGLTSVLTALPTTHVLDDDEVHQALHEALVCCTTKPCHVYCCCSKHLFPCIIPHNPYMSHTPLPSPPHASPPPTPTLSHPPHQSGSCAQCSQGHAYLGTPGVPPRTWCVSHCTHITTRTTWVYQTSHV